MLGQAFLNGAKEKIIQLGSGLYDNMARPFAQGVADALNIDVDIPNFHKLTFNIGVWWEDLKYKWQNNILLPVETAFFTMQDKIQRFFDDIKTKWDNFWNVVNGIVSAIDTFRTNAIANISTFFSTIWTNIVDFFSNIGERVTEFFTITIPQKWAEFWDWLKKLPDKMKNIGKNLAEGLWEGIKNTKDWLWQKLKDWCGSILDGVKGWFGIESPSKVMADEVGKYLAEGVGVGFNKTMPSVIDAMTEKLAEVTDAMQTELSFGDIPQIQGNQIVTENSYVTRNYNNTIETIRQPQSVELVLDGTKLARAIIQPLDNEYNRLGVKI